MRKIALLFFMLPVYSFAQTNVQYSQYLPKEVIAKPINDSLNYVDDTTRNIIISYLKTKNKDISRCFIEKPSAESIKKQNTVTDIPLWFIVSKQDQGKATYNAWSCTLSFDKKTKEVIALTCDR